MKFLPALLLGCTLLMASCHKALVEATYAELEWKDDRYFYQNQPFTGIARDQHKNGSPKCEYPFVKGRFHGVVQEWWENGQRSVETHFEQGQRHGSNRYWNQDGKLTKEQIYDHDTSVSEQRY